MNWIRLKSPPIAWASVLIAIVLARPGTPSTRRWPRARSATIIRSSRWSWPTMTFLTSYSSRSIGTASGAGGLGQGVVVHGSLLGRVDQ